MLLKEPIRLKDFNIEIIFKVFMKLRKKKHVKHVEKTQAALKTVSRIPRSSPKELSRVEGFRLIKNQLVPETVKTSVFRINFNIYVYIHERE